MPKAEEKIPEFVLVDDNNLRYVAKHGWTTQKKYAKRFIAEDAEGQIQRASFNGTLLVMEPSEDEDGQK